MKKGLDSKIPKPVPSKTNSVRSNESTSSSHHHHHHQESKRGNVKFTTAEALMNSSDIGFKIVKQDLKPPSGCRGRRESRSRVTVSSNNSNSSSCGSRRSSKSPGSQKHKILVYENSHRRSRASRSVSPYLPEVSSTRAKDDTNNLYQEIYVSDREFKLLQNAAGLQPTSERRPLPKFEKTLFGYVTMPNPAAARSATAPSSTEAKKTSSSTKQLQQKQSQQPSSSHTAINSKAEVRESVRTSKSLCSKETAADIKKVQNANSTVTAESGTFVEANFSEFDPHYVEYRTFLEKMKERLHNDSSSSVNPAQCYQSSPILDTTNQGTATEKNGNVDKNFSCELLKRPRSSKILQYEEQFSLSDPRYSTSSLLQWQEVTTSSSSMDCSPSLGEKMKRSVTVAAETSLVLMNTLFKDALKDPHSSAQLFESQLFRKFINVESEKDALEKAARIYESAHKSILGFLQHSTNELDSARVTRREPTTDNSQDSEKLNEISQIDAKPTMAESRLSIHGPEVKRLMETLDETFTVEDAPKMSANVTDTNQSVTDKRLEAAAPPRPVSIGVDWSTERLLQWSYGTEMRQPLHMVVTTAPEPGFLVQTITFKDHEFILNYVGNTRKVSSLISSSKSKAKTINLTPFQLLDMADRCFTHLSIRLEIIKQCLQQSSQNLGQVVKDYAEGKHGHYSKSVKKSNVKLQGLNTFSGIVLQISRVLTRVSEKLHIALGIFEKLSDLFQSARLVSSGTQLQPTRKNLELPPQSSDSQESIDEVIKVVDDIDNVLEIGKNSLAAVYSKTISDVKLKKSLRDNLECLFQAVLELDSKDDIDFGSLFISALGSTGMLLSCKNVPKFDSTLQRSILSNLTKIRADIQELQSISKRMNFVAGYLTSKSLLNLKNNRDAARMVQEKHMQLKNIPWYKRRLFSRVLERTYSMISIPSPVRALSEDETTQEPSKEVEIVKLHQANDCSRYSTMSENEAI